MASAIRPIFYLILFFISLSLSVRATTHLCINLLYDAWRDQRSNTDTVPNSQFDSHNPQPYFPPTDLQSLEMGLRAARQRALYWIVRLPLTSGSAVVGRVRRIEDGEVEMEIARGEYRTVRLSDVQLNGVTLTQNLYDPPASLLQMRPSEIAAEQGMLYLISGCRRLEILLDKLGRGAMVARDAGGERWRVANYLTLVGPEQMRLVRTSSFELVFRLRVLDRDDYFVTPIENYGTRTAQTVDATDRLGLARIFWELAGGHGGSRNEVVVRESIDYSDLVGIYVDPESYATTLSALQSSGIQPPTGRTWQELLVPASRLGNIRHP